MSRYPDKISYSMKYSDNEYEYRHVALTRDIYKQLPRPLRLLSEDEWRGYGVEQSKGWVHYEIHQPEGHILLFRRKLGTDPRSGKVRRKKTRSTIATTN